jgi:hypothetical protein
MAAGADPAAGTEARALGNRRGYGVEREGLSSRRPPSSPARHPGSSADPATVVDSVEGFGARGRRGGSRGSCSSSAHDGAPSSHDGLPHHDGVYRAAEGKEPHLSSQPRRVVATCDSCGPGLATAVVATDGGGLMHAVTTAVTYGGGGGSG